MARAALGIAPNALQTFALCDLTFEVPYFCPSAFPKYKKIYDKVLSIDLTCESSKAVSSPRSCILD